MKLSVKKILINNKANIASALHKLAKTGLRCLIVVDNKKNFLGTITDGDLRIAILNKKNFKLKINDFYNSNSSFIFKKKFNKEKAKKLMFEKNITLIPIINENRSVAGYCNIHDNSSEKKVVKKSNIVLIMAGGKGTRMQPFTSILPKPLLPFKEKPVLVHIMNVFKNDGYTNFLVSINKNQKILKSYLNLLDKVYNFRLIEETNPLGTGGALKKLKNVNEPFFIINCDSLLKVKPKELITYHTENDNYLTLVAAIKKFNIPYGVCELNKKNGNLIKMTEKPSQNIFANTGIYVCNPKLLKYLPKKNNFDMSEIVSTMLKKKKKIGVFPIKENQWQDTGNWADYLSLINNKYPK